MRPVSTLLVTKNTIPRRSHTMQINPARSCATSILPFAPIDASVSRGFSYPFPHYTLVSSRSHWHVHVAAQCIAPLGMENGSIRDEDITASSSFDSGNVGPQHGRWVRIYANQINQTSAAVNTTRQSFTSSPDGMAGYAEDKAAFRIGKDAALESDNGSN